MRIYLLVLIFLVQTMDAKGARNFQTPIGILQSDNSVKMAELSLDIKESKWPAAGCVFWLFLAGYYGSLFPSVFLSDARSADKGAVIYIVGTIAMLAFLVIMEAALYDQYAEWSLPVEGKSVPVCWPEFVKREKGKDKYETLLVQGTDPFGQALDVLDSGCLSFYDRNSTYVSLRDDINILPKQTGAIFDSQGRFVPIYNPRLVFDPKFFEARKEDQKAPLKDFLYVQVFFYDSTEDWSAVVKLADFEKWNLSGAPDHSLVASQLQHYAMPIARSGDSLQLGIVALGRFAAVSKPPRERPRETQISFVKINRSGLPKFLSELTKYSPQKEWVVPSSRIAGFLKGDNPLPIYDRSLQNAKAQNDKSGLDASQWATPGYLDLEATLLEGFVMHVSPDGFEDWVERLKFVRGVLEVRENPGERVESFREAKRGD